MGTSSIKRCQGKNPDILKGGLARKALMLATILVMQATAFFAGNIVAKDITGKVTSATDNEPLIGATVQVEGSQGGTITDFDGNYTIKANDGQTLVFSYIGYVTKKVKVKGNVINISLEEDGKSLEEVVVIGYGTMKKKLVTGATTQLKGDDIQKLNTTNPLAAMQGQTPGVNIVSTSGQPGASMSVTIRGLGTVGNSQPLYLIDGIGGDITTLNPADIERIDKELSKSISDDTKAVLLTAKAINYIILQNPDSAIAELDNAAKNTAENDELWKLIRFEYGAALNKRMEIRLSKGESSDSKEIEQIREYWTECENDAELGLYATFNLGNLCYNTGNYKEAVLHYDRITLKDKNFADAHFNKALAKMKDGDFDLESIKNDLSAAGELGIYQAYSILKRLLDAESKSRKN